MGGARNVIASLWKVDDQATAALMGLFYHKLWVEKKTPLVALRESQLALYRNPDKIGDLATTRGPELAGVVKLIDGGQDMRVLRSAGRGMADRRRAAGRRVWRQPLRRLKENRGTGPDSDVTIRAEVLKRVYDDLLLDAKVQFLFHANLIAVESEAGKVSAAILAGKSGLFAVKARVFLDCTGDGDLAAWAGAPFEKGDEHGNMMAGTLCSLWARKSLLEYERYYKKYLKGFEQMELVATASQLGSRESRRILGDYVLNVEDFKSRAVFPDEIGRYNYAVDIHAAKPDLASYRRYAEDFQKLRYGKGESYGIPCRCLVPRKLTNVLVAGRCVSTDRYMQSSIRVMPGCFITGQGPLLGLPKKVSDQSCGGPAHGNQLVSRSSSGGRPLFDVRTTVPRRPPASPFRD